MNYIKQSITLLFLFSIFSFICVGYTQAAKWTLMIYMDGDNNLESDLLDDFLEMAQIGSSDDVNILVQMDRISGESSAYDDWTTTKRFRVTQAMKPTAANALEDLGEKNMGAPDVLKEFIQWSVINYPADKYALILSNHGGGWRGTGERKKSPFRAVCWDDTSNYDCLFMSEVKEAVTEAGTHIDLVGFDACLMGMVEVNYALSSLCDVVVSSEQVEPIDGWPFNIILQALGSIPTMSAATLGTTIVEKYEAYYGSLSDCTLSVIDMSKLDTLVSQIDILADSMNWANGNIHWDEVNTARNNCYAYLYNFTYSIDLYHFCDELKDSSTDNTVKANADNVMAAVTGAVIANYYGAIGPDTDYGSYGTAIYFPANELAYLTDPDYPGYEESNTTYIVDYVHDHTWDNFLKRFYDGFSPTDTYEPNDSFELAYGNLISGVTYESYITNFLDVDYYKIEPSSGTLTIELWSLPADYDLYLYDSNHNYLSDSRNEGTDPESIIYDITENDVYYIIVEPYAGSSTSDSYLLKATFSATADSTPPTGTPGTPTDVGDYSLSDCITFTWTQGTAEDIESGIVGYYLQVSTDTSFSTCSYDEDVGNSVSKEISGCIDGFTYYARVRAKNGADLYSEYSQRSDGITIDTVVPCISLSLSPSSPLGTGSAKVSLTINEDNWISQTPTLSYTPYQSTAINIPLIGKDKDWSGTFYIESTTSEGTSAFSCSIVDAAGNPGAIISTGSFEIEKTIKTEKGGTISNSDGTRVVIPADILPVDTDVDITITVGDLESSIINNAQENAQEDLGIKIIQTDNPTRNFSVIDADTGENVTRIYGEATVTIPYQDVDQDGIVDGTTIDENSLRIFYLNTVTQRWKLIKNVQVNVGENTVSSEVEHFSVFTIMGYNGLNLSALDNVYHYPNPCYPARGQQVTIVNLPIDYLMIIYVYNINGELVRKLKENDEIERCPSSAKAVWDCKNESGEEVASGVYIYLIAAGSERKTGKKIAIIK